MSTDTATAATAAHLDDLLQRLREHGLTWPEAAWLREAPGLQRLGDTLVCDDPAWAQAPAVAWVRAQIERGPGHALVLGLLGHGLQSRTWRCFVATPRAVVAVERMLPLWQDDAAAGCAGSMALIGQLLDKAARDGGPRRVLVSSPIDGEGFAPVDQWPLAAHRLPPQRLAWLQALAA